MWIDLSQLLMIKNTGSSTYEHIWSWQSSSLWEVKKKRKVTEIPENDQIQNQTAYNNT